MKTVWIAAALAAACMASLAKIPAPVLDDAAKEKAAEAAAKTAWQGKVDAYLLCKAQDRVAGYYRSHTGSGAGKDVKPVALATAMNAAAPPGSALSAASSASSTTRSSIPAVAAASAAVPAGMVAAKPSVAGGTAAAAAGPATPTPCADPGVFAFNAPSQKPLEASGAHSPAGNATSPPSNRATSAEMAPAKK
ncbi:MAG: hypothetical protein NVS3B2_00260 [Ramlibacter sp.]